MDFSIPSEYLDFKQKVIDFARKNLNHGLIERDKKECFSREIWDKCADFGLLKMGVPAAYGGDLEEVDLLRSIVAMEGFGYACPDNGLALAINAHNWPVELTINVFGTENQKQKYLPDMATGKWIGAHALTEPEAGSDVFSMQLTAQKQDGGYLLNGEKCMISLGPVADVTVVLGTTNPKLGKWGVTAFLVEKGTPGFIQSELISKMGLRTVPMGNLTFENCFIPEENRLGAEGAGFSVINHSLEHDRCCVLASHLGAMQRQLEDSITYAKTRKQYGQPIGKFQSVSNRIVDMKMRLETSRLLLYQVAWKKKNGDPSFLESAMLKLQISEAFLNSSIDAIRTRGGSGYLTETEVERDLRDATGGVLYAGTSDIQRNIIAKLMGL